MAGALSQIGSGLVNSVLGNNETAYLVVDDYRDTCTPVQNAALAGGLAAGLNQARAAANAVNTGVQAMEGVRSAAAQALSGGVPAHETPTGCKQKYFKVQFNPSELQINGMTIPSGMQDAQVTAGQQRPVQNANQKPNITLAANLYFDAMNHADAFMGDKFNLAGAAETVVNAASLLSGKVFTVQPQVEALIGALHNSYTRYVTFYWGSFKFSGKLNSVGAQYTMFSIAGRPIRAQVALRIRQELDPAKVGDWYAAFTSSFSNGGKSLVGAAQKVGNLLNLNL